MRYFRSGLGFAPLAPWLLHSEVYPGVFASSSSFWSSTSSWFDGDSFYGYYSYLFAEYPDCASRGYPPKIGDGDCDLDNSNEECGYDGGDCCICTCEDTEGHTCGENGGYYCLDPDVSVECREESKSYVPSSSSASGYHFSQYPGCFEADGWAESIGDGSCDIRNSNEECAYDGGDCCSCTCVDTRHNACGSSGGYYCKDPSVSAECKEESASYIPYISSTTGYRLSQYPGCLEAGGWALSIGDGNCNYDNSIEECAYDGGDCCSCTCADGEVHTCGENAYLCRDPTVSDECREESASHVPSSSTSSLRYQLNQYPDCALAGGYFHSIGDGYCTRENNVKECGYDGGDCCLCTCEDSEYTTCGQYFGYICLDPSVSPECLEESRAFVLSSSLYWLPYVEYPECSAAGGYPYGIGDSHCELSNNIEQCNYDGGDCCSCTCVDDEYGRCGEYGGYLCRDPAVSPECVEESASYRYSSSSTYWYFANQYPECNAAGGWAGVIGNGNCDFDNSNEACDYDGGDCCSCTCVDTEKRTCGENGGYYCRDPSVSDACMEESASYIPLVPSSYLYNFNQHPGCFEAGGYASDIGDGHCDYSNNKEECAYDGGDCCSCTCEDSVYNACGEYGYDCKDPTVSEACRDESISRSSLSWTS